MHCLNNASFREDGRIQCPDHMRLTLFIPDYWYVLLFLHQKEKKINLHIRVIAKHTCFSHRSSCNLYITNSYHFTIGGRLTLTTAVLSALPSFAMSVLPIPKGTLAKMDRPRRSMFWKAKEKCSGGDCQVAWDYVCRLRSEGGLGVVDLGLQNKCLLLKAVHGLFSGRDSPWTRWIKRSYLCEHPQAATPA
jgi:hypothetical protein